jgi:TRAP transporter TAXI family solute receptor
MYRGMDADNKQATVMNLLVAHQNMDEKTAYNIVKAVFDHKEDLVRVHKEAENFKLENQKKDASPIPWHPGAVKYFSEKGIKLQ